MAALLPATNSTLADDDSELDTQDPARTLLLSRTDRGHCRSAQNIPIDVIENRLEELGDKGRPIIVSCVSGNQSRQATVKLEENGSNQVEDDGGFSRLDCTKI